jgi:microcystin-dependent protein
MRNFLMCIFALSLVGILAFPQPVRAQASDPFLGQLMLFAGNFCPQGWAVAEGQLQPISQNTALFSILGTTYGGDGVTTFALPDLRGRAPILSGQGPGLNNYVEGQMGGAESFTLSTSQMPIHNHPLVASQNPADIFSPMGALLAANEHTSKGKQKDTIPFYTLPGSNQVQMANTAIGNAGGNQPVEFRSPYIAMMWCIAVQGVFPSRP